MSHLGHKRTWRLQFAMSALHSIADIAITDCQCTDQPRAMVAFVLQCRTALHMKPHFLLFRPDDHCPVNSVAILCMRNADPLRAVQQQIGAMASRISPLF
jgi:hypothetical protein